MITYHQAFLYQLENTVYCSIIVILSILFSSESEKQKWYGMFSDDKGRNPYFRLFMVWFWFFAIPVLTWYYQIPRYGFWEKLFNINPYMGWILRIGSMVIFLGLYFYWKRKNFTNPSR